MDLYIRASEIKNNHSLILCMVTCSDHDDGIYFLWG